MSRLTMESGGRIAYIDIAKGIGILLVLLGHLLPSNSFVKASIYAFHMPLFFIVAGGGKIEDYSFKQYATKRGYQIMIPYFLWALMYAHLDIRSCAFILYGSNESLLIGQSNGMLWFLTALFVGSMFSYVVNSRVKINRFRILAIVVFGAVAAALRYVKGHVDFFEEYGFPLGIDVACLATAFILTGPIVIPKVHRIIKSHGNLLACLAGILLASVSCMGKFIETHHGYQTMATLDVGPISLYFVVALLATVGILSISELFEKNRQTSACLSWLGRNSLLVFVTHRIVLYQLKGWYAEHHSIIILLVAFMCLAIFSSICAVVTRKLVPNLAGRMN